jgi:hypothetical protein
MGGLFKLLGSFISAVVGLPVKLISGIVGAVGGIFKGKSSSGFYLEVEDAKGTGSAPETVAPKAEKPAPVAAEAAKTAPVATALNLPKPTVTTFATDYLVPKATTSRRRPGANMTAYLDMARQAKTPI